MCPYLYETVCEAYGLRINLYLSIVFSRFGKDMQVSEGKVAIIDGAGWLVVGRGRALLALVLGGGLGAVGSSGSIVWNDVTRSI